jgi:glycosidase
MITSTQDLGSTIIRCGHKYQVIGANHSIKRYFDILPTNNTSLNATLRFNYFDAELNSLDETIIDMYPSIDYINWTDAGIDIRNTGSNYSEKTGINSFARWTLFNPTGALPVTGMLLSGRWRNNAAQLNWTTFTEINNDHFNIERKYSDENDFRTVTTKKSFYSNGNSQSPTGYNLTDPAAGNRGLIFYRLKQIDKNGRFAYSNTIALRPETLKVFIEKTFPTLATELSIYVQTGGLNLQKMSMEVFDMAGKLYLSKELNYESQWVTLPLLASGLYRMKIQSGEYLYQQSFFKK